MINGHGDEFFVDKKKEMLDFSSTVWTGGDKKLLEEHLIQELPQAIEHFPEPDAATLRKMIARRSSLSEDSIIITNGHASAFHLISQAFQGKRILIPVPSFSEYTDAARLFGLDITFVSTLTPINEWPLEKVDLCYICTPNNPDGSIISHIELTNLISSHPSVQFIIDQAYSNYTTTNQLKQSDIQRFPNMIMVWSFSHAYGIPGLRIGYITANEEITKKIRPYIIPWSINSLAIEAAKYILIHPAQFTLPIRKWQRLTQELINRLKNIVELDVIASETSFFLIRLKKGNATDLKSFLLEKHNIIIRNANNFQELDDSYIRITARTEHDNNKLITAIQEWAEQL